MTRMHLPDVVQQHRDAIAALCERAHARRLDLFGSGVREDFDPNRSDLDFLVSFDDLPPASYAHAFFALKDGLERLLERPVDLVVDRAIRNPYFRQQVEAERQAVYGG
jgi:predicted nucleotidyltransferase